MEKRFLKNPRWSAFAITFFTMVYMGAHKGGGEELITRANTVFISP